MKTHLKQVSCQSPALPSEDKRDPAAASGCSGPAAYPGDAQQQPNTTTCREPLKPPFYSHILTGAEAKTYLQDDNTSLKVLSRYWAGILLESNSLYSHFQMGKSSTQLLVHFRAVLPHFERAAFLRKGRSNSTPYA